MFDLYGTAAAIALDDGGTDAELHEKSVFFSLNMIMASETGIFEYDPQDEPPSGRPPGPWDGYNFFTIDLSTVKDNIEDMLARIAALEDALEACHDCRDEVVAALQRYDPDYDPAEGECPAPKVGEIVDHAKEYDDCKAEVVAKLQEYDPNFNPQTCEDIVDKIDEIEEEAEKPPQYTFEQDPTSPTYPDPDFPDKIRDLIGNDNLTDNDVQVEVRYIDEPHSGGHNIYYGFYTTDGTFLDKTQSFASSMSDKLEGFKILDYTTGSYEFYWVLSPTDRYYYTGTSSHLIGYGDPTHSYTVSKNS